MSRRARRRCAGTIEGPCYDLDVEAPLATEVPFQPPPGVRLVVLFGSHGTPRARPDSDVDLLVVLDGDTPTARLAAAAALAASFDRPVDIVFEADAGPQLRFEVARSGRPPWRDPSAIGFASRLRR